MNTILLFNFNLLGVLLAGGGVIFALPILKALCLLVMIEFFVRYAIIFTHLVNERNSPLEIDKFLFPIVWIF